MLSQGQLPKISQEQIILQNEQTPHTLQAVVCPVCLTVLSLPHWRCQSCDNAVCRSCMEDWWQKQPQTCIFKCKEPQFKIVKRSNTYQAIIDILKVKCRYCEQPTTVSSVQSHDKLCLKKPILCRNQGCGASVTRQQMDEHDKNCQFKIQKCQFCQQNHRVTSIQKHREECPQRPLICQNQGCMLTFPACDFPDHQKQCSFQLLKCRWCGKTFKRSEFQNHEENCEIRQSTCEWCSTIIIGDNILDHKVMCPERLDECALCSKKIRLVEQKDHKIDCMFKQMIVQRAYCQRLASDNMKLKLKVSQLEFQLQQKYQNQHKLTALSLMKIKEEEKKQFEKDLLRIRNSIASIKKCRNQQMSEHLKRLHLSTSLCVFCASIRKKLEDELAPLIRLQAETLMKIRDMERTEGATKKSMIRE